MELVIQIQERLRRAQKEITAKIQVRKIMVDDLRLRGAIEIDQDVAAKNQVHALHEKHP